MNDISASIKKVLFVFLLCFMGLIMYLTYFEFFIGPKVAADTRNQRLWVKRNEVLRGTIYDRSMKALTKSERVNELTQKREYTGGEAFTPVLGYVNSKYGLNGLEKQYDQQLMYTEPDLPNIFNFTKKETKKQEKVGNSIETTLNSDIQKKAYDLLGSNKGAVVALNPKTGEILAMVSKPSYDANNLNAIWASLNSDPNRPLVNRAVMGLYPPGSTFKTVTAISSLQNIDGVINSTYNDTGKLYFNKKDSLSNFDGEVLGHLSFKEAYVKSSNFVFGTLGMKLGNSKLKATAESFYFNKQIPCDDITISASKFPALKSYEIGNIAQSAIGQSSVVATPMQMAEIASSIAYYGVMMKPYLVSNVLNSKGKVVKTASQEALGNIISADTAKTMKDFMRTVVTEGTGTAANLQGANICGKTGTAEHGNDGSSSPHSWFIGFAPYDNPQIAVAVIVEDGGQGGIAAAKIAAQVMQMGIK